MARTRFTVAYDLANMVPAPKATSAVRTIYKSEDGIIDCFGTGAPPTTANTYAEGCTYRKINDTAGNTLYVNRGSYASPDFEKIQHGELATAADDGGTSPALWDDAPVMEVMLDPGKGFHVFEDFLQEGDETNYGGETAKQTGSGTFTDNPALAGGVMVLDNVASTSNHTINLNFPGMQCKPGVGTHIYFEARLAISHDDAGILIGLMDDSSTDQIGSGTIVTNTDHAVFFRDTDTTSTKIGCQACDGSGITSSDDDAVITAAAYHTFGIHIFGDGDTADDYVKFYFDGELVVTVTDADAGGDDGVPDAIICPTFNLDNLADGDQMTMSIDWMRLLVYNATSGTVRV